MKRYCSSKGRLKIEKGDTDWDELDLLFLVYTHRFTFHLFVRD